MKKLLIFILLNTMFLTFTSFTPSKVENKTISPYGIINSFGEYFVNSEDFTNEEWYHMRDIAERICYEIYPYELAIWISIEFKYCLYIHSIYLDVKFPAAIIIAELQSHYPNLRVTSFREWQ